MTVNCTFSSDEAFKGLRIVWSNSFSDADAAGCAGYAGYAGYADYFYDLKHAEPNNYTHVPYKHSLGVFLIMQGLEVQSLKQSANYSSDMKMLPSNR